MRLNTYKRHVYCPIYKVIIVRKPSPVTTYQNVLLIEDDFDDRDFFVEVLQGIDKSIACTVAPNGIIGLEMLKTMPAASTIVFLDLNLPMMSGLEVLEIIRKDKNLKDLPVIVLTTSKNFAEECSRLGASLYVIKPSCEEIFRTVLAIILQNDVVKECQRVSQLVEAAISEEQNSH